MKFFTSLLTNKKQWIPPLVIVVVLVIGGTIAYAFSPKSPLVAKSSETETKTVAYAVKLTSTPTTTPSVTGTPQKAVLGTQTKKVPPQPTVIVAAHEKAQGGSSTTTTNTVQTAAAATNTPVPQQATQVPTQAQPAAQTVSVSVNAPDGSSSFTVEYSEGMTVCSVMQKAKDSGKIASITFDDSYMATLKSLYVSELNGHANNWTFTVNGTSPLGCSLSQPKPNDTIVWKFG